MDEVDAVAALFDQYRVHYGESADVERSVRWLQENMEAGRLRTFVAEDAARFVGFATTMDMPASLRLSHFWQIRDLFVLPQRRRSGLGAALLGAVRAAAVESGALRLAIQTEDENGPALALYTQVGFVQVDGYRTLTMAFG